MVGAFGAARALWHPQRVIVMGGSLVLIGLFVLGLFLVGDARAQVSTVSQAVDKLQDMHAPKPKGAAEPSASSAENVPSANPLWSIPLISLTETRERPVFSPSRRPRPTAVVAKALPPPPPPPKPAEREKLQLSLVGTILGKNWERTGLFVNLADKNTVHLKLGQDHKGWVLRAVRPRQVTLEKGQQTAVLELPQRDARIGSLPSPPLSATPVAAANVAQPPVPTSPLVNPFAVGQVESTPSPPIANPFATDPMQKAQLR